MATFISDNQKFHIFSKSPVRANMELFQATNKSGHTVISDEVRTDDIPWFINVPDVNNPPSYVKDPRKNDIIFQGKFNSLSTAAVCKRWDGEKWVDGPNLKENPILKNENDDDVIQVHFENDIEYVSDTNNAGTTSDKQAAFVLKTNGEMLTHFVSPTDKIYNGIPSNGYGLYLFLDNQLQSETDSNDSGYIANSYAGIIQFNNARSESASKFKVITFEYIGGYLNKSLDKIEDDLKDYIDEEIKEHNKEFIAHKNNENAEKHLSQSEVDGLNTLTSANKISGIETATQYDYQAEADLSKALSAEITTPNASDSTFKNVTIKLHLRDKVLQQSTMPVTSKAIYNHVHKQSVNIEKASDNVTVEEVTTNENERRKYTIAVDGYTTSETDNIVDDIHEKIQTTADDINKNVAEHTSNNGIHITDTERVSWNNNEVVLQKHLNDQNLHISDEDREKWATKDELSSHTSDTDIHITADERSKWNTASQKTDRLTFPTTYTNFYDNQYYVNSYGFEYVKLIEDAWIQNIEVSVVLPELRDSLTEINLASDSTITPNIIGEKVCKILVAEGLNSDWGDNFNKNDDEIELGTSEYNICEKDKNNSLLVTLNFTFDQPIFLKANKDYRFYFYDRNENPYALPIIVNVDDSNNITNNRKEVASRNLYTRYDYFGVWGSGGDVPSPYAPYGLKVKLSKDIYSAFIAHENNSDIHITESEREKWNTTTATATTLTSDLKTIIPNSYSVKGTGRSGAFTTFVLPNDFYPAGVQFNSVKIETININGTIPTEAYLGVMAFYPDGTKKKLSISDNTNISATKGNPVWYFSTPFTITEDYKLIFYILKDKESFIEPEPIVDRNVAIGAMVYDIDVPDPYYDWSGAQTNLNFGFIVNGEFIPSKSYPSWPGCTLYEINHVNDENIHLSQKDRKRLDEEYIIVDENGNPVEITFSDRITDGTQMFSSWAMDTFIHSLPQLKNGYQMFRNCKNLTTFLGELPLLEDGTQMFFSCKLNALSVITIINSLKNNLASAEKSYSIHLGISEETKTDENLLLVLEESGNEVGSSYNITNKNGATWTINFIINV